MAAGSNGPEPITPADMRRIATDRAAASTAERATGLGTTQRDAEVVTFPNLVQRAREEARPGARRLLGITGAPGAGKSTLARRIAEALGPRLAVVVPMDGFHLANDTLTAWGSRDRKGAWDTFDADGYVALLRRLREEDAPVVHAPDFDRDLDAAIAAAIPVSSQVPLVITEGNYLLSEVGGWARVRSLLDRSWYLDLDEVTRTARLVRRHVDTGMSTAQAAAWAGGSDQVNANLVRAARSRADRVWRLAGSGGAESTAPGPGSP